MLACSFTFEGTVNLGQYHSVASLWQIQNHHLPWRASVFAGNDYQKYQKQSPMNLAKKSKARFHPNMHLFSLPQQCQSIEDQKYIEPEVRAHRTHKFLSRCGQAKEGLGSSRMFSV
jgi:hypothetical protein